MQGFDFFSSPACLRLKGESDVSSVCGGITSALILIFFFYLFIAEVVDMANFGKIEATETTIVKKSLFSSHSKHQRILRILYLPLGSGD